ncbi:MAG: RDD family protein [Candidatus Adiutrix sp.]|jgi:uncharacterized RDD family membrane protein YckC|nr:RDD family protein [Candidatus Adiutrix sp.]
MATTTDRVGALIEGIKRNRRVIVSPEGVPLEVQAAGHSERLAALLLDLLIMFGVIVGLYLFLLVLLFSRLNFSIGLTLILFIVFVVRNFYFMHFELAWQGRTPGKKICGLRVINRHGGELSPSAVIARNLTREVEIFMPLSMLVSLGGDASGWLILSLLGWLTALTSLPLWGRDHLRVGDLIGGTQVIAMPRRALLDDLAAAPPQEAAEREYVFAPGQLAIYGAFELQVLEEFLRRPPTKMTQQLLAGVCLKISRKIGWEEPVPPAKVRRFLTDFYAAERADLERGQLFGRHKADQGAAAAGRRDRSRGGKTGKK